MIFLHKGSIKRWVTPTVTLMISMGVTTIVTSKKKIVRDYMVAREPGSHQNIELSDRLKSLIEETYREVSPNLGKSSQNRLYRTIFHEEGTDLRWFSAKTFEPIAVGGIDALGGGIIGLPCIYNYTNTLEVPDTLIYFKKLRIFKKYFKETKGDELDVSKLRPDMSLDGELIPPWESAIDRKDPRIKQYLESLILSDEAIKYVVARELHLLDQPWMALLLMNFTWAMFLPIIWSRYLIRQRGYEKKPFFKRLPVYLNMSILSFVAFRSLGCYINSYYQKIAHENALRTGKDYINGAIEYNEKMIQRHKALHALFVDARDFYDENGEKYRSFLSFSSPFQYIEALDMAKRKLSIIES